jgi:hypothetical protein
VALQIALLRRRQSLIEQDTFGTFSFDQRLDFIGFAEADKQRRIRGFAPCDKARNRRVTSRLGEECEFVQAGIERRAPTKVDANQNGARRAQRIRTKGIGLRIQDATDRDCARPFVVRQVLIVRSDGN